MIRTLAEEMNRLAIIMVACDADHDKVIRGKTGEHSFPRKTLTIADMLRMSGEDKNNGR